MSHYQDYIIQTHKRVGGASSKSVRANPIDGQGLNTSMKVSCSNKMRSDNPIGSYIKVQAKLTSREGSPPFLYAHPSSSYEIISEEAAIEFVRNKYA